MSITGREGARLGPLTKCARVFQQWYEIIKFQPVLYVKVKFQRRWEFNILYLTVVH